MVIAKSKMSTGGYLLIPEAVRKKLGVRTTKAVEMEWDWDGERISLRRLVPAIGEIHARRPGVSK